MHKQLIVLPLLFALLATPAVADTIHQCEDGSALIIRSGDRGDAVIYRGGEMDIALPIRVRDDFGTVWTPRTKLQENTCDEHSAPCAMQARGDYVWYWYSLTPGVFITCGSTE